MFRESQVRPHNFLNVLFTDFKFPFGDLGKTQQRQFRKPATSRILIGGNDSNDNMKILVQLMFFIRIHHHTCFLLNNYFLRNKALYSISHFLLVVKMLIQPGFNESWCLTYLHILLTFMFT